MEQWTRAEGEGWGRGLPPLQLWVSGLTPRKIFENIGANPCNLVHFLAISATKCTTQWLTRFWEISLWYGKSTLFRATFKTGTEFTVPAYRFRGRCNANSVLFVFYMVIVPAQACAYYLIWSTQSKIDIFTRHSLWKDKKETSLPVIHKLWVTWAWVRCSWAICLLRCIKLNHMLSRCLVFFQIGSWCFYCR